MAEQDLLQILRDVEFLEGIPDEYLGQLARVARIVEFPARKVIFREGDPANRLFLILDGSISLEICAPGIGCKRILTLTEGELLGWSPVLLEQSKLTATARTLSPSRAVEIDGGQVLTLCEHNPRFGFEFMRRAARALAKRLTATRLQLLDVYGGEMPTIEEQRET